MIVIIKHNTNSIEFCVKYKTMIYNDQLTLAEIVTADNRAAVVLEQFQLDFCCRGKRTLKDACVESNVALEEVKTLLQNIAEDRNRKTTKSFNEMTADELISHIMRYHHFYVRQAVPQLINFLAKLFQKHRENFAWVEEGYKTFLLLQEDLLQHMDKEEHVLFPLIKSMANDVATKTKHTCIINIMGPLSVMESEHLDAGKLMERLRVITNNFTPEEKACTTHRVALVSLKEFEENLHQHVHLENNLLFPLAIKLYKELTA